jgi:hypothetical protein
MGWVAGEVGSRGGGGAIGSSVREGSDPGGFTGTGGEKKTEREDEAKRLSSGKRNAFP